VYGASLDVGSARKPILTPEALKDQVTSLPDFHYKISFNHYAGYITVDEKRGRRLFYWFVESQRAPLDDPVTMWLNGGPGCSSLDGMLYEHGPFHFERPLSFPPNDTLYLNPHSWNKVSNMLYVEAPAGVGFSYSDTRTDYNTNDTQTAADNYQFILNWFERFPQFRNNDFYVAGESYAGIYVPSLAYNIVKGNQAGKPRVNIKGMLVGNGVTDYKIEADSFIQFAWYHGLYSNDLHSKIEAVCKDFMNPTPTCNRLIADMYAAIGNVNIYDIYLPCYNPFPMSQSIAARARAGYRSEVPCIDSSVAENYLNRADVRTALHAEPVSKIGAWAICSDKINYTSVYSSVIPFYPTLMDNIRILIYSGDVDGAVPFVGTQKWVDSLKRHVVSKWQPWSVGRQVAGYVTIYDKITFLTVKGAGHMVPQWKPAQAFRMFQNMMEGVYTSSN
jgi:serine carboxypeptidase-like clade 1